MNITKKEITRLRKIHSEIVMTVCTDIKNIKMSQITFLIDMLEATIRYLENAKKDDDEKKLSTKSTELST